MAEVVHTGYGKNEVRLMRVRREGDKYFVTELKVNIELQLDSTKDYSKADNSDVVPTDSQKNTVMVLAKQNIVSKLVSWDVFEETIGTSYCSSLPPSSPEEFGLLVCSHFLETYQRVWIPIKIHNLNH